MRILLTGFEAFGDSDINPSEMLVRSFEGRAAAGFDIVTAVLPVDTHQAPQALCERLERVEPQAVVCLGEAAGRAAISIERLAVNLLDFRIPDNAGNRLADQPIRPDGPAAYFSTLPVRRLLDALTAQSIPVQLSLSAGAYLCNQVFYHLMHWIHQRPPLIPAGFIHLPSLPQQMAQREKTGPSMSLETTRAALMVVLDVLKTSNSEATPP